MNILIALYQWTHSNELFAWLLIFVMAMIIMQGVGHIIGSQYLGLILGLAWVAGLQVIMVFISPQYYWVAIMIFLMTFCIGIFATLIRHNSVVKE